MNGYWLFRRLVSSLSLAGLLLLLTACQGLAAGSNGSGSVGVGNGSLDFGTVAIGDSKTLPDTLSNHTSAPVTISSIQGLGSAFEVTGITLPTVLAAGQTAQFNVQFAPADPGDPATTIAFAGQGAEPYVSLAASGIAATRGELVLSPSPVVFGSTKVGASQTSTVTLANSGGTDLTIASATLSGAAFSLGNLTLPLVLRGGASTSLAITFAPNGSGNFTGSIAFVSTAGRKTNRTTLSLTGVGIGPGQLTASAPSMAFGNVQVGANSSQPETLTNTGGTTVTISLATASGTGFSISGLNLPVTLAANQSATFNVIFTPASAGAASGAVSIVSDASNSPLSIPLSGTGQSAGALTANPGSASFGNVTVGSNQTVSVAITNTGGSGVTITSALASGNGFSVTGPSLPITLNAGQSSSFSVAFAPSNPGAATGALTIGSNANNPTLSVPLSGTGVAQGQLGSNPSTFSFGNVQIGTSNSLIGTLTNSGGSSLTISAAAASGTGFSLSGLSLPVTLTAGQSTSFTLLFSPTASGAASGSVTLTSNGSNPNLSIPLSGTGVAQGSLSANPTSLAFGSVQLGSSSSLTETLTNSGGSSLTISAAAASGTGFSLSGLSLPVTLTAGQSTSFTVLFSPTASGAASGSVTLTSNGSNPNLSIPLSGTGVAQGSLSANPTSLAFGSVQLGSSSSLTETVTNTGGAAVTISQASSTAAAFSISGLNLPLTLTPNQSATFSVTFTPTSSGAASGSLSLGSNASNSPLTIALSGTGTAAGQLAVSPTNLSFGNVAVGSSATLSGTLNASGAAVTITSASLSNGEFAVSGLSLPATLAAGQSASFSVTFTPQASGATSATLSFASNAVNSPAVQSMTGTGTTPVQHSADLSWNSSNDAVGYNIYRSTVSGGPYTMVNPTLDGTTAYTDNTVDSGQTYYYVATAVDASSQESGYSAEVQAVIPTP